MTKFDKAMIAFAVLAANALVALFAYAIVTGSDRREAIHASNVCGEQEIVAISRPKATTFTLVLCKDGTVRGVK